VPHGFPYCAVNVAAKFNRYAAKDQQPEDHHQRKVEAAEPAGVQCRKGKIESSAGCEKPYFIAVPHGADAGKNLAAFLVGFGHPEMDGAGSEIKAVQENIDSDHD